MTLRETRFEDAGAIAAVLARNGLRTPTDEQWRYLWDGPPDEALGGIPRGWVLENEPGGIVGTFRNVPFMYEWNGHPVRTVVASAWAVDPEHRRGSLGLATEFFRQRGVDLLLNTTAVPETSGKAFLAFGASRVPQPRYLDRLLWLTGPVGFAKHMLAARGLPASRVLAGPLGLLLGAADRSRGGGTPARAPHGIVEMPMFDERFDRLWRALRGRPDRLQAVRDRATLEWKFRLESPAQPPVILVHQTADGISGYVVLVRREDVDPPLSRFEVADLQAIDEQAGVIAALMAGALVAARERGVHVVGVTGQNDATRTALASLKPHLKVAPGWPLYYKAIEPSLREPLQGERAWDLSPFDGDGLWSGVFREN